MRLVRTKLAELTRGIRTHVELDTFVSRHGGFVNLFDTEFAGADRGEFLYEWENLKLSFRGRMTRED